jgi:hypothetical protein
MLMACLPKLPHRHGWFCHLIGAYSAYFIHQIAKTAIR